MILILIGKSGSGKSAIEKRLIECHGYSHVITCTTRSRRDDELDDAYHFMSWKEFTEHMKNGDFVESDVYGKNLYGMLKSSLESTEKLIAVLTPDGAKAVKKAFPTAFVVHIVTDTKTAMLRAIKRETEIDPAKIHTISIRASQDHYLYEKPACDLEISNSDDACICDIAWNIAKAHMEYESSLHQAINMK